jgi:GAF domain-containing protein
MLESECGAEAIGVADGRGAIDVIASTRRIDVAVVDHVLEGESSGIDVTRSIRQQAPWTEVILLTGKSGLSAAEALAAGAAGYVRKPPDPDELKIRVQVAVAQSRNSQILAAILAGGSRQETLREICAAAAAIAQADDACVVLCTPQGLAMHGLGGARRDRIWERHFTEECITRSIIETGQPVDVPDTLNDNRVNPTIPAAGFRSFIGVPIPGPRGSTNIGAVYVYSSRPRAFGEPVLVRRLSAFAFQAGLAVSYAAALADVSAHANFMEALVEAGRNLAVSDSLEDQLRVTSIFLHAVLGSRTHFVAIATCGRISFPLAVEDTLPLLIEERLARSASEPRTITDYVFGTGYEVCWSSREEADAACAQLGIRSLRVGKESASFLFTPILAAGAMIGVLSIQSDRPNAFTPAQLDGCRALAVQLGSSIQQGHLHAQERTRREEAEQLIRIARNLSQAADSASLIQSVVPSLAEVVRADVYCLWVESPARDGTFALHTILNGNGSATPAGVQPGTLFPTRQLENRPFTLSSGGPGADLLGELGIRTLYCAPLVVDAAPFGLLSIGRREIVEEDTAPTLLQLFAQHASLALRKTAVYEETRAVLVAARELAENIVLQDLGKSLDTVARSTLGILGCDAVAIYTCSTECRSIDGTAAVVCSTNTRPETEAAVRNWPGELRGCVEEALASGQLRLLQSGSDAAGQRGAPGVVGPKRHGAAMPLQIGGLPVGVMLVTYEHSHRFTRSDVANIRLFASHAAVAISENRVYERLAQELETSRALQELSLSLAACVEVDDVLGMVSASAIHSVDATGCGFVMWDREQSKFTKTYLKPNRDEPLALVDVPLPGKNGTSAQVLRTGDTVVIDVRATPADRAQLARSYGWATVAAFPMVSSSIVVGVMYVDFAKARELTQHDRDLLRSIASLGAIATARSLQYDELRQTKGLVGARTALAWVGMASATWSHATEKSAKVIEEAAARLKSQLQKAGLDGTLRSDVSKVLAMIDRSAKDIRRTKPLPGLQKPSVQTASLHLNELLRTRTRKLWAAPQYQSVSLDLQLAVSEEQTVRVDQNWFLAALDILIDNACLAMKGRPGSALTIETAMQRDLVRIRVRDNGPGFAKDALRSVQEKEPVQKAPGEGGTGMGFLMADLIAQTFGGRLEVEWTNASGTSMAIFLPAEEFS